MGIKCDNRDELFPLVNECGDVVGCATRGECHDGSKMLHPVVHLQLFNSSGEIYLQRRPAWKDIQPNRWDTAVGGHVDYGEDIEIALAREVREELGIGEGMAFEFVAKYPFESSVEWELIYTYKVIYDGEIYPSDELDGGRFWSREEIDEAIKSGGVLTENFVNEYLQYLSK